MSNFSSLALVAAGGAGGAVLRHLTGLLALRLAGPGFPWATMAVNIVGGFAMGVLAGVIARAGAGGEPWRLLLGTGLLGGFTTFSAFSMDAVMMIERGDMALAGGYVLASVALAMAALWAGLMLARVTI